MKKPLLSAILLGVAMTAHAEDFHNRHQQYLPQSKLAYQSAPSDYFSGQARFARYPSTPESSDGIAVVEFDKGTVTNWHTHSHGQYLIVTSGEGYTQEWGKPVLRIKKGDVVWCPPNVKHWHGATQSSAMSHIAIAPNAKENKATWLEKVDLASLPEETAQKRFFQNTPLTARQLAIVPIASLSALGDLDNLKTAIDKGLNVGLSVNEIQELFTHQYAYAGIPRALNGINTLNAVLKARQDRGIVDKTDNQTVDFAGGDTAYQTGVANLTTLTGRAPADVLAGYQGVDYALKAHLFGYLFSRENLSPVDRQLVTLSTLMALGNVNAQLKSHLNNTQNLGVTKDDLYKVINRMQSVLGKQKGDNARAVLESR